MARSITLLQSTVHFSAMLESNALRGVAGAELCRCRLRNLCQVLQPKWCVGWNKIAGTSNLATIVFPFSLLFKEPRMHFSMFRLILRAVQLPVSYLNNEIPWPLRRPCLEDEQASGNLQDTTTLLQREWFAAAEQILSGYNQILFK